MKCFLLTTFLIMNALPFSWGAAFQICGDLDHITFHGNSSKERRSKFTIMISGSQWQIKNTNDEGAYTETTCDGLSIFHFNKTNLLSFDARYYGIPPRCYWVSIDSGPVPAGNYLVQIPWLAYASSTFAQSNFIYLPAPWLNLRHNPLAHAYEAEVNRLNKPPYLPEMINFTLSQSRAELAPASGWLDTEDHKIDQHWKPREEDGFTGATYKVTAVTNIDNLMFPVDFELVTYRSSSKKSIMGIYRGTNVVIKEISAKTIEPAVPDLPLCVRDFRFQNKEANISHIDYVANNWIMMTQSRDLQKLFGQKLADHTLPLTYITSQRERSDWFYVIFAGTILSPLFILILKWKSLLQNR